MSNETQQKIKDLIRKFCVSNPSLHVKTEEQYFKEIMISIDGIEDYIVLDSIKVCDEKELYRIKHVTYFRGIVLTKKHEKIKHKELEEKYLTPIPTKIIGTL